MDIYTAIKKVINDRQIERQNPQLKIWEAWYKGKYRPFHNYYVTTGFGIKTRLEKRTLGMAKVVSESWADLLMNENTKIMVDGDNQKNLDEILERFDFNTSMNDLVEKYFALGNGAVVLGVNNLSVDNEGIAGKDGELSIQFVDGKKIFPITFENGKCTECAFVSSGTQRTTISVHLINDEGYYEIKNLYYRNANGTLVFESEDSAFNTHSVKPWFALFKPAIVNNFDIRSPMGISVYANSIDVLMSVDNMYDSLDNEFILGKKRLFLSTDLEHIDSEGRRARDYFDPHDVLIYHIPQDSKGNNLLTSQSDELRSSAHIESLNGQLNMLSVKCGLGKGYFMFNGAEQRVAVTATEVIVKNSDLFRTLKKHEKILEKGIKDVIEAIIDICNRFTDISFKEIKRNEIKVLFDDSIFEDKESMKESDRKDVNLGALSLVEYRMRNYGEDEETAIMNMNKFSVKELTSKINALYPALEKKVISVDKFVELVWGDNADNELKNGIIEYLTNRQASPEELFNQFGV